VQNTVLKSTFNISLGKSTESARLFNRKCERSSSVRPRSTQPVVAVWNFRHSALYTMQSNCEFMSFAVVFLHQIVSSKYTLFFFGSKSSGSDHVWVTFVLHFVSVCVYHMKNIKLTYLLTYLCVTWRSAHTVDCMVSVVCDCTVSLFMCLHDITWPRLIDHGNQWRIYGWALAPVWFI